MATHADEVLVNKYFFGNSHGALDEDRLKDGSTSSKNVDNGQTDVSNSDVSEEEYMEEENILTDVWDISFNAKHSQNSARLNADDDCAAFIQKTCGCSMKCSSKFSKELISQSRNDFLTFDYYEFGRNQLDIILLGIIHTLVKSDSMISHARKKVERQRMRLKFSFLFRGRKVCGEFFQFVHGVRRKRLHNLLSHYKHNNFNVLERIHKNFLNAPGTTASNVVHQKVGTFIRNYAEDCSSYFVGISSSATNITILLPGNETKQNVYLKYAIAAQLCEMKQISKKMFYMIWSKYCSDVIIYQKPKEEVEDLSEENDSELNEQSQNHLEPIELDKNKYHFIAIPSFNDPVHISFDFTQQIHIPSRTQDPGPMYFLDLYKVNIFGILNETCKRWCNYIIPEAVIFSKSHAVNAMICYLHHYLQEFADGEAELHLHAYNCSPHSKNNCLMQYLAWRIVQGFNTKITISFVTSDLSKVDPSYKFGLFKNQLQRSVINCLNDVVDILNSSGSNVNENFSFLVGNESGELFIDIYDWQTAFSDANFARIPYITSQSYFYFDKRWVGKVKFQKSLCETTQTFIIFDPSRNLSSICFEKILPLGLSHERKLYLYEQVRPYCTESTKDVLCPCPSVSIKCVKRQKVN